MNTDDRTVDVLIETPRGDYNRYVCDEERRAVRLAEVVYVPEKYPADLGIVPHTLAADGSPLAVLLVNNYPTFPGCLVLARPIGLVEVITMEATNSMVVAVADKDSHFKQIEDASDLPAYRRSDIETMLSGGQTTSARIRWHPASDARDAIRNALRMARLAEASASAERPSSAAWKVILNPHGNGRSALETRADTEAEQAIYRLPYRFQRYIEECLVDEERILYHISRPSLSQGRLPFGRQRLHEAILVVTDQQLLFMSDALPPDATMVHWGYIARTAALERLRQVRVVPVANLVRLECEVEASGGVEHLAFSFPREASGDLERAADLLRRFLPSKGTTHLRRLPEVAKPLPSLERREEDREKEELAQRLEERVSGRLAEGDYILARALAPAWPAKKLGPRLLALSREWLFIIPEPEIPEQGPALEAYDVREISSAEIRHSLLGCYLEVSIPRGAEVQRLRVDFDSPSGEYFTRLFVTLRQLLVTSPACPVGQAKGGLGGTE